MKTGFIAGLLLAATAAGAANERIIELTGDLESVTAGFEQRVVDESGRMVEETTGSFAMQAPNLFRWHYVEPFEQLIVADGTRVWMHDVELEQVTVKDQSTAAASSPLYVLTRPEVMEDRYQVELAREGDRDTVTLEPRATEAEFEWVEIVFENDKLAYLLIQDAFGQQTKIRFIDPVYNAEVEADAFTFEPPEGVDVIGAEELMTETYALPDSG